MRLCGFAKSESRRGQGGSGVAAGTLFECGTQACYCRNSKSMTTAKSWIIKAFQSRSYSSADPGLAQDPIHPDDSQKIVRMRLPESAQISPRNQFRTTLRKVFFRPDFRFCENFPQVWRQPTAQVQTRTHKHLGDWGARCRPSSEMLGGVGWLRGTTQGEIRLTRASRVVPHDTPNCNS